MGWVFGAEQWNECGGGGFAELELGRQRDWFWVEGLPYAAPDESPDPAPDATPDHHRREFPWCDHQWPLRNGRLGELRHEPQLPEQLRK